MNLALDATMTYRAHAEAVGDARPTVELAYLRIIERELLMHEAARRPVEEMSRKEAGELAKHCGAFEAGPVFVISAESLQRLIAKVRT